MRQGKLWIATLTILVVCGVASAEPRDEERKLTWDPVHGWSEPPVPEPDTEDGDLDIARQLIAEEEFDDAEDLLEDWIDDYPTSDRFDEALYFMATAELGEEDWRAADEIYTKLLTDYPGSPFARKALSGMFRVAEQYLAGKRRKAMWGLLRVRDEDRGIEIMDDIIINYPDTELAPLAQKAKADYYFYKRGNFEAAEAEYATFVREYPRSRYHPLALLQSAVSAMASFPGVQFDDAALIEAEERFRQFRSAYPQRAEEHDVPNFLTQIAARRAEKTYEIAWFYDRTAKYPAAKYYYDATVRLWPDTPAADDARQNLARLEREQTGIIDADGIPASETLAPQESP